MKIKQELNMTVTSQEQFKELCSMLNSTVGASPETWRFRKRLEDGEKNKGKRTRIRKALADKGKVELIIEVFNDANLKPEDMMALRLKY